MLWAIIGALYRRYHGGWIEFPHPSIYKKFTKIFLSFALGIAACCMATGSISWLALGMGVWLGYGLIFMPFHALGMGVENAEQVHMLSQRYFDVTFPIGICWYFIGGDISGLYYAPIGLLIPWCYLAARAVWAKWGAKYGWPVEDMERPNFINGYTSVGELCLGAILFGGLFL